MKQMILLPLLAWLLSLGGTTAYLVTTHRPEPVAVDSLAASTAPPAPDSLKHPAARKDSTPADTLQPAGKPDTASIRPRAAPVPPAPAAGPVIPRSRPKAQAAVPVDPVAKAAAYKQVARVLSAMKPAEAAKVLAFLSDEEVEGLLRAVGPRQAADFLANIPKERAAGLSRRLLVPREPGR